MWDYQDCKVTKTDDGFIIENDMIARKVVFYGNVPVTDFIEDKQSGYRWSSPAVPTAAFCLPVLDFGKCKVSFHCFTDDCLGLSHTGLVMETVFEAENVTVNWQNVIFPGIAFVTTRLSIAVSGNVALGKTEDKITVSEGIENVTLGKKESANQGILIPPPDTIEAVRLNSRHTRLTRARLIDVSDHHNNFVEESTEIPYLMWEQPFQGHFFLFDDYIHGRGILLVKEAPCPAGHLAKTKEDLHTYNGHYAFLMGSGVDYANLPEGDEIPLYQASVGVGEAKTLNDEYKKLYRAQYRGLETRGLYMMSNTWGDRSQDAAVCESFMLGEIERAAQIGIDVVQIDDGWQKGKTANSILVKNKLWSGGYYDNDPDFWKPNVEKFPGGLEVIAKAIKDKNLQLGLWFSPDLVSDYELWEKDAEVLLDLHRKYDARFFKLDGIVLRSKQSEINLLKMMRKVTKESGGKVWFNMDITAQVRLGHLYQKEYGSLFIENRYTDSTNYYPHYTLKNVWELAKYIPVGKCQFELLNMRRNEKLYNERYGEPDPLRPALWPMDTVFACSMAACPLFWMEMSHLTEEDAALLAKIVRVYKQHRERMAAGNVRPIGELPDGVSYTGFDINCGDKGYLLLFREFSPEATHFYTTESAGTEFKTLYTNGGGTIEKADGGIQVKLEKPATFLFAQYSHR